MKLFMRSLFGLFVNGDVDVVPRVSFLGRVGVVIHLERAVHAILESGSALLRLVLVLHNTIPACPCCRVLLLKRRL